MYLNQKQLAERWGITRQTLHLMIRDIKLGKKEDGILPKRSRFCRRVVFYLDDVIEFEKKNDIKIKDL